MTIDVYNTQFTLEVERTFDNGHLGTVVIWLVYRLDDTGHYPTLEHRVKLVTNGKNSIYQVDCLGKQFSMQAAARIHEVVSRFVEVSRPKNSQSVQLGSKIL